MEQVELSRFVVTKPLTPNTPWCVVQEVIAAHDIDIGRTNSAPHTTGYGSKLTVNNPLQKDDLPLLATFINKKEKWTVKALLQAYSWFLSFEDGRGFERLSLPLIIGAQTPSIPTSLNACILYRLCLDVGITLYPTMTVEQMAKALTYSKLWSEQPLVLLSSISRLNGASMANLLLSQESHTNSSPVHSLTRYSYEELQRAAAVYSPYLRVSNSGNGSNNGNGGNGGITANIDLLPLDNVQAMYLAAVNYSCDLTMAKNPVREYYRLLSSGNIATYIPEDPTLLNHKSKNPLLLDLRETFNPSLPDSYYTDLPRLANKEGITNEEIRNNSVMELMQVAYLSCTFYEGWQIKTKHNFTTIVREELDDINPSLLLGFGVKDEGLDMVTYQELAEYFTQVKLLSNPAVARECFEPRAIRKLKDICIKPPLCLEQGNDKRVLLSAIEAVEADELQNLKEFKLFGHRYRLYSQAEKQGMLRLIQLLFELSMYMRGWLGGVAPYPISIVPEVDGDEVDVKVAEAFSSFEEKCSNYLMTRDLLALPLVNYQGRYIRSSSRDNGLTIGRRLDIVKEGNNSKNPAACIRLSSNWIAITSNRAVIALGEPPFFEPSKLRQIG